VIARRKSRGLRQSIVLKFSVRGSIRFISHQDMMRVWERAIARAGLNIAFSQGFNPHPRMSLPLPRPVGVESDDEIITIMAGTGDEPENHGQDARATFDLDPEEIKRKLEREMPQGIAIKSVEVRQGRVTMHAEKARFRIRVLPESAAQAIKRGEEIMNNVREGRAIPIQRRAEGEIKRTINAADYIEAIGVHENTINVTYKITQGGSIRIDEVLGVLGVLAPEGAVERTAVEWKYRN
jgi:radical SAM-linked protein